MASPPKGKMNTDLALAASGKRPVVVGRGMMARCFAGFAAARDLVVFASGVSNSLETEVAQFERERQLLLRTRAAYPDATILYFGTCSVFDSDRVATPYVRHKLEMESLLASAEGDYLVLRLPLVIGPTDHGKTLPHFLRARISSGERFQVWTRAIRYPIDVDDVLRIAACLVDNRSLRNRWINVALRAYSVMTFVRIMESILARAANAELVDKGDSYQLVCPEVEELADRMGLDYSEAYLERVLRKYFGS